MVTHYVIMIFKESIVDKVVFAQRSEEKKDESFVDIGGKSF